MGTTRKLVAGSIFLLFISALALRPLLNNPALSAILESGTADWRILLWIPLLFLTALLIIFRVKTLKQGTDASQYDPSASDSKKANSVTQSSSQQLGSIEGLQTDASNNRESNGNTNTDDNAHKQAEHVDFLSGQGGTRDKGFEIEDEPPDAELGDHLDYLEDVLDEREHRTDLDTLAEVVNEYEPENPIPDHCPQEHCNAAWEARTVLGHNRKRYETYDDGTKIQCLKCEEIYRLE